MKQIHKALLLQVLSPGRGQQIKGDFAAAAKIGEVNLQTNSSAKLAGQHFVGSDCRQSCMLLCCATTVTITTTDGRDISIFKHLASEKMMKPLCPDSCTSIANISSISTLRGLRSACSQSGQCCHKHHAACVFQPVSCTFWVQMTNVQILVHVVEQCVEPFQQSAYGIPLSMLIILTRMLRCRQACTLWQWQLDTLILHPRSLS